MRSSTNCHWWFDDKWLGRESLVKLWKEVIPPVTFSNAWAFAGFPKVRFALLRQNDVREGIMATVRGHRGNASNGGTPGATRAPCDVAHGDADLIDQTIAVWQKRSVRKLTREDGREIIENITGFFSILQEWERKERAAEHAKSSRSLDSDGTP